MLTNCPGAQGFRQPEPKIIKCPGCGEELEIWTDEIKVVCPKCKKSVMREGGSSCLDWCKHAKECVGDKVYAQYVQNRAVTVKEKLIKELEEYFGEDKKRIDHAKEVMHFAERLLGEKNAAWHIIIPAAILHDVGIKVAEERYGSSAGNYQEKEGPPIAKKILLKVGLKKEEIDEICEIIAHHHSPGKIDTQNFKVLYDADWLANLKDEVDVTNKTRLGKIIDKVFLTESGKELAKKIYAA